MVFDRQASPPTSPQPRASTCPQRNIDGLLPSKHWSPTRLLYPTVRFDSARDSKGVSRTLQERGTRRIPGRKDLVASSSDLFPQHRSQIETECDKSTQELDYCGWGYLRGLDVIETVRDIAARLPPIPVPL